MNHSITIFLCRCRSLAVATIDKLAESALSPVLFGVALLLISPGLGFEKRFESTREDSPSHAATEDATGRAELKHARTPSRDAILGSILLVAAVIAYADRCGSFSRVKYGRRRGDLAHVGGELQDEASRNRLAQKRLRILNTLVNDNHKLLPSDLTVGDLMTTVVRKVLPSTPINELRALTIEHKIRHVLVCNEYNELLGVVSDRDLRRGSDKLVASDLMTECPKTVSSGSLVNNAITLLLYGHISSLPVVDEGRLVGILTTTDVVMTLQCTLLAVEQMVRDLGTGRRALNAEFAADC